MENHMEMQWKFLKRLNVHYYYYYYYYHLYLPSILLNVVQCSTNSFDHSLCVLFFPFPTTRLSHVYQTTHGKATKPERNS